MIAPERPLGKGLSRQMGGMACLWGGANQLPEVRHF